MSAGRLLAAAALLPGGWAREVLLAWDAQGRLVTVEPASDAAAPQAPGVVVPGMANLHSHAFQRALAGLAEHRGGVADDSFWTWRDLMYRVANRVTPDQLEAIATAAYVEMLCAGYTAVCEFHYLHHDPRGRPYAEPAELGLRLLAAARRAGIGITLLPVLYQQAGFGGTAPRPEQRRFVCDTDALLSIAARLRRHGATVGVAPHSLRAVGPAALRGLVGATRAADPAAPIHVHVAEQRAEVEACLAWSGQRPVGWLLAHAPVDAHWCLVHATHLVEHERRDLAACGAVAGLCPSTEANLGDGVFDAAAYLGAGGAWGIGSDSQVGIDPFGELRALEYGQRLARQCRNVLASEAQPATAERLWLGAVAGGAQASGRPVGGLAVGQQADFLVLDGRGSRAGLDPPQALAAALFAAGPRPAVRDTWVGGVRRVGDGVHALEDVAFRDFEAARRAVLDPA